MFEERTEPATPQRRRKARQEGQVARSPELAACVILLGVLWSLPRLAPRLGEQASEYFVHTIAGMGGPQTPESLGALARDGLVRAGRIAGPILGLVVVAALVSNVLQVGICLSLAQLEPKLSRLDPVRGLRRLLTGHAAVELIKGVAKVALVTVSGWQYCAGHREELLWLIAAPPDQIPPRVGDLALGMATRMAGTLAVLAALDYIYQRWQFERSLRMTKQEVKDELRESEGNPEVKARQRQRQREMTRLRMMAEVPRASVVITNPSHYAVALQYELGRQGAPKVVAKGRDRVAQRIREIAAEHRVPLVENPPLARSLYKLADIGQEIPPALYRAVAEVLALVWRLERRQAAKGRA